jgi:hypothetical protein
MRLRARVATVAIIVALVEISMSVARMAPSVPLVAGLVVLVAAIGFVVYDLDAAVLTVRWQRGASVAPTATGLDPRVSSLRMRLAAADRDGYHARQVYGSLVDLIDDQLLAVHGIDRAADPDAAAVALGPELHRFVATGRPPARLTSVRVLRPIVQRIEQL